MKENLISGIIFKRMQGKPLTPEDESILNRWLAESEENRRAFEEIEDEKEFSVYLSIATDQYKTQLALDRFRKEAFSETAGSAGRGRTFLFFKPWIRYVAAALLIFGIGAYLWQRKSPVEPVEHGVAKKPVEDIQPGRAGAILTLSDGTQIDLDTLKSGVVANENGTKVLLDNGQLRYNATNDAGVGYNTMTTPPGRQFHVRLPDNSSVWLNAGSSIVYPTLFVGKERKVKVTGEVYFEVAKDVRQPFVVDVNGKALVRVLGTRFNINAYENEEAITTTLLEGAVRVQHQDQVTELRPNHQLALGQGPVKIMEVDAQDAVSWINGFFNFNGADMRSVMRQLERWYDVRVELKGKGKEGKFRGKIQRNLTLRQLLENLKHMGVDFNLEGGVLTVY